MTRSQNMPPQDMPPQDMPPQTDDRTLGAVTAHAPGGRRPWHHLRAMQAEMIPYLEHLAAQGDFLRIPLGVTTAYFVNRPDLVQEVLVTQARAFHKPSTVKAVAAKLFGENLFTSDGEVWRVLRKGVQPAFHARRVNAYAESMVQMTQDAISPWQPGQTVEMTQAMMQLTLGITTQALFGMDLRNQEAGDAIVEFIELFNQRISSPAPAWLPTKADRQMRGLIQAGVDLLQPLIEERRASGQDTGDVLSMLLAAQAGDTTGILTDDQVRNEISNLFAAGYEVVGNTLCFTLYLIAAHPQVEAALLAEIRATLGDRPVTVADLAQMPVLERVLNESMRLLPATTVVARQVAEPVTVAGVAMRRNDVVMVAPWTLHRRPDLFPDPLVFDPERFGPERREMIPKHGFIPFSTGPRICLGSAFATLQMKVNLATILQQWRPSLLPDYTLSPVYRFNTRPDGGLPMRVDRA